MLPKISGFCLSSESSFSIVCPHCEKVNEIKVARFVVGVARSESFVCVACDGKFTVEIVPQLSGNLTQRPPDLGKSPRLKMNPSPPQAGNAYRWADCPKG